MKSTSGSSKQSKMISKEVGVRGLIFGTTDVGCEVCDVRQD